MELSVYPAPSFISFLFPPQVFMVSRIDRKSTRLNSSHTVISYAVFCLKKKSQTFLHLCLGILKLLKEKNKVRTILRAFVFDMVHYRSEREEYRRIFLCLFIFSNYFQTFQSLFYFLDHISLINMIFIKTEISTSKRLSKWN